MLNPVKLIIFCLVVASSIHSSDRVKQLRCSLEYSRESAIQGRFEEAIEEYTLVLNEAPVGSKEYVDALWGRMSAYFFCEMIAEAEYDYLLIRDQDPMYPVVDEVSDGWIRVSNCWIDRQHLLIALQALDYSGTLEDIIQLPEGGAYLVRDVGLDMSCGSCQDCHEPRHHRRLCQIESLSGGPHIHEPPPIDPPAVGGGHYPDRFGRGGIPFSDDRDWNERMAEGIAACENKCNISAVSLAVYIGEAAPGVILKIMGCATVELLRQKCTKCCKSGNFWGECIEPIAKKIRLFQNALADIGRWPDPLWNDD